MMAPWQEWPNPYELAPDPHSSTPLTPGWQRKTAVNTGADMATRLLADPSFARLYYNVVAAYNAQPADYIVRYSTVIGQLSGTSMEEFNAHDLANVHHSAWLHLLRALVSLTNQNIHGDNGDPPPNGTTHRDPERIFGGEHAEWFHNIPNGTGSYALTTQDVSSANPGV
jgi:hypothetical protein